MININDMFWTFQGEGANAGMRALFVRMPFCNLACSWCDTQFNTFKRWTRSELIDFAKQEKAKFAVITGGEPMMNKQVPTVVNALMDLGFFIATETNGCYPIWDGIHFVTVSPKRDARYLIHPNAEARAKEFKYVVDEGFDWNILRRHNTRDGRRYSLSPEFGRFDKSLAEIFDYIKENPEWRVSLQTHKWMKIP